MNRELIRLARATATDARRHLEVDDGWDGISGVLFALVDVVPLICDEAMLAKDHEAKFLQRAHELEVVSAELLKCKQDHGAVLHALRVDLERANERVRALEREIAQRSS